MIKSVELFNFQSHAHTIVNLTGGMNIITGPSDSGKTVIMRAIRWVSKNEPNGTALISRWAFDKRGRQTEDCRVIVTFDDGKTVERIRGTINGYIINGEKTLEAVGNGVPDEVADIFKFSDVNIQKQLDSPFLLSASSGDVARFLNTLVNLEDADIYQSAIESKRRRVGANIKLTQDTITKIEGDIRGLSWIDKAEILITKYKSLSEANTILSNNIASVMRDIARIQEQRRMLLSTECISLAIPLIKKIEETTARMNTHHSNINAITALLDSYFSYEKDMGVPVEKAEKAIVRIQNLYSAQSKTASDTARVTADISSMRTTHTTIQENEEEQFKAEQELATQQWCPLCGKVMEHEICTF